MAFSRKALVTGASEGIGRAMCLKLAQAGYEVTAVARNESRLNELLRELPGVGHQKTVADLSTPQGVKEVTKVLSSQHYSLLMNNAGFGYLGDFAEQDIGKVQQMMDLNMSALVQLSYAFLSQSQSGDALINVSSTLSFLPMPLQCVYAATKAFVTFFTESLWAQQKGRGVHVINLCPGITATQFNSRAGGDKRKLPTAITQSPDEVVECVYNALLKKQGPTIISGWKNQLMTFFPRLLSRKWVVKMMGLARQ